MSVPDSGIRTHARRPIVPSALGNQTMSDYWGTSCIKDTRDNAFYIWHRKTCDQPVLTSIIPWSFLSSSIPISRTYDVIVSQLVRAVRVSYPDFIISGYMFTSKLRDMWNLDDVRLQRSSMDMIVVLCLIRLLGNPSTPNLIIWVHACEPRGAHSTGSPALCELDLYSSDCVSPVLLFYNGLRDVSL